VLDIKRIEREKICSSGYGPFHNSKYFYL